MPRVLGVVEAPLRLFGLHLGCRMTIIRIWNDQLLLVSPTPFSQDLANELAEWGRVSYIVAPNLFHHLYVGDYLRAYPEAKLYAFEELAKKRPDLGAFQPLTQADKAQWHNALEIFHFNCGGFREAVFYHVASQTLICTDLVMNFRRGNGIVDTIFKIIYGAYGKFGPTRVVRYFLRQHAQESRQAIDRIASLKIDRIIMAHGEVFEDADAREQFVRSFSWLKAIG